MPDVGADAGRRRVCAAWTRRRWFEEDTLVRHGPGATRGAADRGGKVEVDGSCLKLYSEALETHIDAGK